LLRVQAPLAGTIVRLNVKPGEAVDLTTVMAEIIDLDRLVVSAQVPSRELAGLKVGQTAEVLADKSASSVTDTLTYIGLEVDPKTDTALVRAKLPAHSGLRPGQFVTARIVSEEHRDRLAVPVESVVKGPEGSTVIALVQGDKATQKPVRAGLRDGALVEVEAEGLQPGMSVVTQGAYALPKETKVRVLSQ
jgi:membrane fusion protein (multidrug efflux system)